MSFTHNFNLQWQEGISTLNARATETNDSEKNVDATCPGDTGGGATTTAVALAFGLTAVTSIYITSDQDVTIKSVGHTPGDDLVMKAGFAYVWLKNSGAKNQYASDVASIDVVNANPDNGSQHATVNFRVTLDTTS